MSFCVDLVSEDSFYENITLGVTKLLESDPRISNVMVERRPPCDRVALSTWEQKHSATLPEDLRNFYTSSDGFQLTWHYKYSGKYDTTQLPPCKVTQHDLCTTQKFRFPWMLEGLSSIYLYSLVTLIKSNLDFMRLCLKTLWKTCVPTGLPSYKRNIIDCLKCLLQIWPMPLGYQPKLLPPDEVLPVGSIRVNTLNELCLSPTLKDLLDFSLTRQNPGPRPVFNTKSKVFELDSCRTIGKVCLVYTAGSWSVWLATREGAWGWLADSFTHYFRMALVHLGLPGWQAAFANLPLIPWAEQLFLLLAPHLLEKSEVENNSISIGSETGLNHIDPNIFKTSVRQHKGTTRQNN